MTYMLKSKISNAPKNNSFAASFMHLKLKRLLRKIIWRWGKAKLGSDYRIVNNMCSFEGD